MIDCVERPRRRDELCDEAGSVGWLDGGAVAWLRDGGADVSGSMGTEKRAMVSCRRRADILPSKRTYGMLLGHQQWVLITTGYETVPLLVQCLRDLTRSVRLTFEQHAYGDTDLVQKRCELREDERLVGFRSESQQGDELVDLGGGPCPEVVVVIFHFVVKTHRCLCKLGRRRWFYQLGQPQGTSILHNRN